MFLPNKFFILRVVLIDCFIIFQRQSSLPFAGFHLKEMSYTSDSSIYYFQKASVVTGYHTTLFGSY